jgi:hypothetical protein
MKYKVHRFDLQMTADQRGLEQFLNNVEKTVADTKKNSKGGK